MTGLAIASIAPGCLSELPVLDDPCIEWPDPGLFRVKIDEPSEPLRKPYVYVPKSKGPRDLVILLHGGGMSGPKFEEVTGFEDLADRDGLVVVYPNGLGWPVRSWNAGERYGDDGNHDDVAFLDDVISDVYPKVCGGRVLVAGFSNGSMMAQRWACQGKVPLDGVGASSGPLLYDSCEGDPLPIRYYHGKQDPVVPIDGGSARGLDYPSIDESMAVWRTRNRCSDDPPVVTVDGDTTCSEWKCEASTVQCVIDGWPHQWPGGIHATATDANATGAIWDWFATAAPVPAGD